MTSERVVPIALALAATSIASGLACAQSLTETDPHVIESLDRRTTDTPLEERLARDWRLEVEEWTRYRELMQGPLGVYSPDIDPLTAPGIEARTDDERRRYAELQIRLEAQRVEKLLAYQRAYDAAWQRLYPALQPVAGLAGADATVDRARGDGRLAEAPTVFLRRATETDPLVAYRLERDHRRRLLLCLALSARIVAMIQGLKHVVTLLACSPEVNRRIRPKG